MSNWDKRMIGAIVGLIAAGVGAYFLWGWAGTLLVVGALVYQGVRA